MISYDMICYAAYMIYYIYFYDHIYADFCIVRVKESVTNLGYIIFVSYWMVKHYIGELRFELFSKFSSYHR